MTFKEQVLHIIKEHEKEYHPVDDYVTADALAWLYEEIRMLDDRPWCVDELPAEKGFYAVCYFADGKYSHGFADWNGECWEEHFSFNDAGCKIVAWQKITPFIRMN